MYSTSERPRPPTILILVGVIIASAMLLPIFYLVLRSLTIGPEILSLFFNKRLLIVMVNSTLLAFFVTAFSTFISIPLAYLTVRTDLPFKGFWSVATVLPLAIPSYVGSYAVIAAFGPKGSIVQSLLQPYGVEKLPSIYGWSGAIITLTLFSYPYILLTIRSSLHSFDPSLEEASRTLGADSRETFRRITLPHLKPSIAAGALLVAFYTLSDFGTPSLMRFDSFTRAIYIQYQSSFDRSMASVLALTLVALAGLTLFIEYLLRGKARYYSVSSGSKKTQKPIRLGAWRIPALLFCGIIVFLSLVMPLATVLFWLFRGLIAGETFNFVGSLAYNSVTVSSVTAIVAISFALPVSFMAVRYPSRLSNALERSTYIGFALPGIVVALSLVFFGVRYLTPFYQTYYMLIFAYIILFLPQAVGTIRTSLLLVSPRIEEAARSLGRSQLGTIRSITMPLIKPGALTGASLVFLTTMKELPATLLLAPTGFNTLATRVWSATDNAFFTRAAAPSLILILISTFSMFIIQSQEKSRMDELKK